MQVFYSMVAWLKSERLNDTEMQMGVFMGVYKKTKHNKLY